MNVNTQISKINTVEQAIALLAQCSAISGISDAVKYLEQRALRYQLLFLYSYYFPQQYSQSRASVYPNLEEDEEWLKYTERELEFLQLINDNLFPLGYLDYLLEEHTYLIEPSQILVTPLGIGQLEDYEMSYCDLAIAESTIGYQLLQKKYELTCLNHKCLKYKEPLHNLNLCPFCQQKTKRAELSWLVDEPSFAEPLTNKLNTICTKIELDPNFYQQLQPAINNIKQVLQAHSPNFVWEYPLEFMVLHSFGHLILTALSLLRMGASSDLNFLIDSSQPKLYTGYFYDTNEGGNGASETVWRYFTQLADKSIALAKQCDCNNGCPRCLHHTNCPDRNRGLLKQLGIAAGELITIEK